MVPFHLDWHRDRRGYILADEPKSSDARRARGYSERLARELDDDSLDTIFEPSLWVTRRGGPLDSYRPLDIPRLYEKLALHDATADGALALVKTYGFLIDDTASAEHVSIITNAIHFLRGLITAMYARDWHGLRERLEERDYFFVGDALTVEFLPPLNSERPTLRLRPAALLTAAILQLLQDAAVGQRVRQCARPGCGNIIEYGPGTGRRKSARYCSKKCKDAHSYLNRKEAQR